MAPIKTIELLVYCPLFLGSLAAFSNKENQIDQYDFSYATSYQS